MRIGVVGAGVFGLAAAIEAAARGHQVAIFEQGEIPHPAASSTDVAKGIRRMWYASDNETYVELAERAGVRSGGLGSSGRVINSTTRSGACGQ